MHSRVAGMSGFFSPGARSTPTPVVIIKNVCGHCQVSPSSKMPSSELEAENLTKSPGTSRTFVLMFQTRVGETGIRKKNERDRAFFKE